jgi:hypothetical protein
MDTIRTTSNQTCTALLTDAVAHIDRLLSNKLLNPGIKAIFKLNGLSDADFASVIQEPLGYVQAGNWDPSVGSDYWKRFCDRLGSGKANSPLAIIKKRAVVLNYAKWIKEVRSFFCPSFSHLYCSLSSNVKQVVIKDCTGKAEECFGTDDDARYQDTSLDQTWRAWVWQVRLSTLKTY